MRLFQANMCCLSHSECQPCSWCLWLAQKETPTKSYINHVNHMTMTTSGQITLWPDYLKTKGNMNIKLRDGLHFAQYIWISPHDIDCKKTDVRRVIT